LDYILLEERSAKNALLVESNVEGSGGELERKKGIVEWRRVGIRAEDDEQ